MPGDRTSTDGWFGAHKGRLALSQSVRTAIYLLLVSSKITENFGFPGIPPQVFSSHSFRRGGYTFAFLCGVPTELIKLLGGWESDCYFHYLEFPMEARAAVTQLMKHRIQCMRW